MKKILILMLAVWVIISCLCVSSFAQQEGKDLSVTQGSHSVDGRISVLEQYQLITNARSVFLYEIGSDTLMYSWNPDEKLEPASLVKIMTAMLALERGQLTDAVVVTQSALSLLPSDAFMTGLLAGETLTLKDLLYCMLVDSGNDAATVIAEYIAGSEQAFVAEMNTRAQELGCIATNFVNCTGLYHEDQYTTARDMTRILSQAVKNPAFCEVFGTVFYTVPATELSEERSLDSQNFLLSEHILEIYYDTRVLGSRTGINSAGERSVATHAKSGDLEFVAIVMGSQSQFSDAGYTTSYGGFPETISLLDAGFNGYYMAQVVFEGQVGKQCDVMDGDSKVSLGSRISASTVLPQGVDLSDMSVTYFDKNAQLNAPVEKGVVLSTVQLMYGNRFVAQADLYALNDVRSQSAGVGAIERKDQESDSGSKAVTVILLIFGAGAVALIGYMIRRRSAGISNHSRSRDYRNYRRSR